MKTYQRKAGRFPIGGSEIAKRLLGNGSDLCENCKSFATVFAKCVLSGRTIKSCKQSECLRKLHIESPYL